MSVETPTPPDIHAATLSPDDIASRLKRMRGALEKSEAPAPPRRTPNPATMSPEAQAALVARREAVAAALHVARLQSQYDPADIPAALEADGAHPNDIRRALSLAAESGAIREKKLPREFRPKPPPPPGGNGQEPTVIELDQAKQANQVPFRNFVPVEVEKQVRGKTVTEIAKEPRAHQPMLDDINARFLGFPRKSGESILFDYDRDSQRIFYIPDADYLMSWIGRKSKHPVQWARGECFVSQRQFYLSVLAEATRYESISNIPSWPRRADVFYSHLPLPPPCPEHSRFNALLDMLLPETPEDRCLMAAMLCCPLWYIPYIPRPAWIVDSHDGQGSGKTTLVELVSMLYGAEPIKANRVMMDNRAEVIHKRCLSIDGRHKRVFLLDNATGDFHCDELASMMTASAITGMAPYGRGEETRPNDLTYVITANSASVSPDIADRSLYVYVTKPPDVDTSEEESWKTTILRHIQTNQLAIIADIIHILESHTRFDGVKLRTRFKEFEASILHPCCGSHGMVERVIERVIGARDASNIERDQARAIIETFEYELEVLGLAGVPVFIRSEVCNSWGRRALNESMGPEWKGNPIQLIRQLSARGHIPQIDKTVTRVERQSKLERHRGLAWTGGDSGATFCHSAPFVNLVAKGADTVIRSRVI